MRRGSSPQRHGEFTDVLLPRQPRHSPKRRAVAICKVWLRNIAWDWPAHPKCGDAVRIGPLQASPCSENMKVGWKMMRFGGKGQTMSPIPGPQAGTEWEFQDWEHPILSRVGLRDVPGHTAPVSLQSPSSLPAVPLQVPMGHWQQESCCSPHGSGDPLWGPGTRWLEGDIFSCPVRAPCLVPPGPVWGQQPGM